VALAGSLRPQRRRPIMTTARNRPDISLFDNGRVFPLRSSISFILGTKSRQTTRSKGATPCIFPCFSELQPPVRTQPGDRDGTACALETWAVFCRGPSRAKSCGRAVDPKSRASETTASGLNKRLHGAWGSSRSFVVECSVSPQFTESRSPESGVERRGRPQTKTPQTRLSRGTFAEQPSPEVCSHLA